MGISFNFDEQAFQRQIIEKAKEMGEAHARRRIIEVLGPVDAAKITLTVEMDPSGNPCVRVEGPDHLKARIGKIDFNA